MSRREREEIQAIVVDVINGYNTSRVNSNVNPEPIALAFSAVYNDYLCFDGTLRERHIELAGYLTGYIQGLMQAGLEEAPNGLSMDLLADMADYLEDMIYLKDYDEGQK